MIGPSPAALAAVSASHDLTHAPEPDSTTLRQALADRYQLPADAFLVGPGAASLLHGLVARWCATDRQHVVWSKPSFHLYQGLTEAYNLPATPVPLHGYQHDLPGIAAALRDRPGLVLLDSPHNITGTTVALSDAVTLAADAPPRTVVVYDNVYGEYQDVNNDADLRAAVSSAQPVIITRSFSKAHRLFGLRAGYLIADPDVLRTFGPIVLRYDVGTLTQQAAQAAIQDRGTAAANRQTIIEARRHLQRVVEQAGFGCVHSQSDSVLVAAGSDTPLIEQALQQANCQVRGPRHHGMQGHVQIVVSDVETPQRVAQALTLSNCESPT